MNPVRILAAATIIAAGFAHPAFAEPRDRDVQHVPVRISDLDLNQEADARRLLSRIGRAARRSCHQPYREVEMMAGAVACRKEAVQAAVRKIDAPLLTAIYSGAEQSVLASK